MEDFSWIWVEYRCWLHQILHGNGGNRSGKGSYFSLLLLPLCPPLPVGAVAPPPEEGLDDLVVEDEEDDAGDVEGGQRRQDDEVGVVELALRHL